MRTDRVIATLNLGWLLLLLPTSVGAERAEETALPDLGSLDFAPLEIQSSEQSGEVNAFIVGPNGFLWFGTRGGAHRYDGYSIKTYAHLRDDATSLVNSIVHCFYLDTSGRLWIGTERGLSRYRVATDDFANYLLDSHDPHSNVGNHSNAIVQDSRGTLYASSESGFIYRYDPVADSFERVNRSPFGIIKSMVLDDRDRLWVGSLQALYRFDPQSGSTRRFSRMFDPSSSLMNFVESLSYVSDEEIWMGTAADGVMILNSVTGEVQRTPISFGDEGYVHDLHRDSEGNLWIAHGAGITVRPAGSDEWIHYPRENGLPSLPPSGMRSTFVGPQGNVWVGTQHHGIYVAARKKAFHRFQPYAITDAAIYQPVVSALLHDRGGNLWVGLSSSGVDVFPADGGPPRQYRFSPGDAHSIARHTVFELFEDSRGTIWVGSYMGGLQRYDPEIDGFVSYRHDPSDPRSLPGDDVRAIAEDETGNLWMVTHGRGIAYFDRATGHFSNIRKDPRSIASLIDDWPLALHYSSQGKVFVGTAVGLSVLDPESGTIRNFQPNPNNPRGLSNAVINTIFEDSLGRIWLGTNDGVNRFDPESGRAELVTIEDGLPNRVAVSIAEDRQGQIWVGTSRGLARIDPERMTARGFDAGDGLSDNEFYPGAVSMTADGRLFFGQKNGISHFDPTEIRDNTVPPIIHLTDLKVFNRSLTIDPGRDIPDSLPRSLITLDSITLSPHQKSITIKYVGLSYIQPAKNQYAYRLVGFDTQWIQAGTSREATYTNLPPGSYTFELRASNNDGYWNENARSLTIHIPPAFWQTWWFRTLTVGAIVLLPLAIIVFRLRHGRHERARLESQVRDRTQELEQTNHELERAYRDLQHTRDRIQLQNNELEGHQENLEEMVRQRTHELAEAKEHAESSDRLKSAFLANVSHEIRTPMNAIMGFLEILREDALTPEEREEYHHIIVKSGETLLRLIDDILDLSKIEAGETIMHPEPTDVDFVCEELCSRFTQLAEKEKADAVQVVLDRQGKPSEPQREAPSLALIDANRLKQVLSNLLSNAVKFTESGEVRFGYSITPATAPADEPEIRFFVRDTGIGIPSDELGSIFARFHKVERGNQLYEGTGLGLSITKKLVEMMDGQIRVDSEEGVGSEFIITFPHVTPPPSWGQGAFERRGPRVRIFKQSKGRKELEGCRILVAEDEDTSFEFIRKTLTDTGAEVDRARDGEETLERFNQKDYHLILLDMKMPRIDGFAVARRIRQSNHEVPIIAQTAFAMIEDQEASIDAGADTYLAKPFTRSDLLSRVRDLLQRSISSS